MKKKLSLVLGMILTLSLCLLTACGGGNGNGGSGGEKLELAGTAWESEGTAYHFFEDGVVVVDTGYTLSYTWDGNHGEISDGGITAELIYDEDGLFLEGEDEQFYELTRVGEADASLLDGGDDSDDDSDNDSENNAADSSSDTIDLVGTAWELDGNSLHFFTNGTVATSDGGILSYTWDGSSGAITDGTTSMEMVYDEDGFFVEMNDGDLYAFTYAGEADLTLLLDEEDDSSDDVDDGEELGGAYDNDNEEMSIVFHSDGTCTITSASQQVEGSYTLDANDNLYIETDTDSAEGWYDSSDDTFSLEGLDGWFYYTGSAGYTP